MREYLGLCVPTTRIFPKFSNQGPTPKLPGIHKDRLELEHPSEDLNALSWIARKKMEETSLPHPKYKQI